MRDRGVGSGDEGGTGPLVSRGEGRGEMGEGAADADADGDGSGGGDGGGGGGGGADGGVVFPTPSGVSHGAHQYEPRVGPGIYNSHLR